MHHHFKHAIIAAAVSLAAIPAMAQQAPQWYVGFGAGKSKTSDDIVDQRESSIVNGSATGSTFDDSDGAFKAFAGWQVNDLFALEAFYADLGETHLVTNTVSASAGLPGTFDMKRRVDGFGLDGLVRGNFAQGLSVFARAGIFASRVRGDATVSGSLIFVSDPTATSKSTTASKSVAHYGVGGEWAFQPNTSVRLEYERFDKMGKAFAVGATGTTGEASTDLVSLSLLMRF
jgi:OOP family OmpA-OmpF porin